MARQMVTEVRRPQSNMVGNAFHTKCADSTLIVEGTASGLHIVNSTGTVRRTSFKSIGSKRLSSISVQTTQFQNQQTVEINVASRQDELAFLIYKRTQAIDECIRVQIVHILDWVVQQYRAEMRPALMDRVA